MGRLCHGSISGDTHHLACLHVNRLSVGGGRVAVPWTTLALMPHWFRGMPGRHGLITISMMLPLPGAVWASAFQATELASRIAAVAVSTTTSLRIGVLSTKKRPVLDCRDPIQTGLLPAHTKGSEWGFDLVHALVLRASDEAKCSFGHINDDGAG